MTPDRLELLFLLPETDFLPSQTKIERDTLVVECSTRQEATRFKRSTYRSLLNAIAPKQDKTPIRSVRYRWGLGQLEGWEMPLYFTD